MSLTIIVILLSFAIFALVIGAIAVKAIVEALRTEVDHKKRTLQLKLNIQNNFNEENASYIRRIRDLTQAIRDQSQTESRNTQTS